MQNGQRASRAMRLVGAGVISLCVAACGGSPAGFISTASTGTASAGGAQFAQIRTESNGRVFLAAPEPAGGTTMRAATGFGIVRDSKVEAYLQTIVAKLMDHWHGDKPERVGIFIESGGSVQGKATPSGDILIPIGAFDGIENEDQLAALIGHELGHVILKHHEDEKQAKQLAQLGEMAVGAVMLVSSFQNGESEKIGNTRHFRITRPGAVQDDTLNAFAVHTGMVTLTQDIILSAYSRDQEYTADVFGATLSGKAGWDQRAILSLIQKWHDAEETQRLRKEEMMKTAGLVPGILQSIGDAAASVTGSHPSAEKRRDNVVTALQTAFPNSTPVPPITAPFEKAVNSKEFARKRAAWRDINQANKLVQEGKGNEAVAILRKIEKQAEAAHPESRLVMSLAFASLRTPQASETAYQLLSTADLRQPATLTFYNQVAMEHTFHKNWDAAEGVIKAGERYYGERLLPTRIAVLREQTVGQPQMPKHISDQISALMQQCNKSSDPELPKACTAAATGQDGDAEYNVCGGVINALASLSGQGKCNSEQMAKASAPSAGGGGMVTGIVGSLFKGF